ncbi:MAG: T9SS type A sorting domain-containing protein [Cytophagales bacterium]
MLHIKIFYPLFFKLISLGCLIIILGTNQTYAQAEPGPDVQFAISTSPTGGKWCPYLDIEINVTNQYTLSATESAEYNWTFEGGTPSTYFAFVTNSSGSPTPPSVYWTTEGTFTISLIASKYDQFEQLIDQDSWEEEITINATCCQNELIAASRTLSGTISNTTYSGIWLITSDITITTSVTLDDGLFLMEGEAVINNSGAGPGGIVTSTFINVDDNAEFIVDGGSIRGACETMWGGINAGDDALIDFDNAYVSDSYEGIYADPNNSSPINYNINLSEFNNNKRCLTAIDIDGTLNGVNILYFNNFHCNPSEYLEPFGNTTYNTGEEFRMEYAIRLIGNTKMDVDHFSSNQFDNALVGVEFRNDLDITYPLLNIKSNTFKNIQFIGVYAENRIGIGLEEYNSFTIPISPNINATQYSNYVYTEYSHIPDGVYGVVGWNTLDVFNYDTHIISDSEDDPYFENIRRVGILAHLEKFYNTGTGFYLLPHLELYNSEIGRMHIAVDITNDADFAEISENIFTDNKIALHYNSDPIANTEFSHNEFSCNKFELVEPSSSVTYYGMYIREDCDFNDMQIGGISTLIPQGNGWPIDYNNSPGSLDDPPTTIGGSLGVTLTNWNAPINWYSIYDENTHPWEYIRYNNEFVGEHNGTVFPSSRINNVSTNAPSTNCIAFLNIPFPQTRISGFLKENVFTDLLIFPNPVDRGTEIKIENIGIKTIKLYNGTFVSLNIVFESNDSEFLIHTDNLIAGIYFLEIQLLNGVRKTSKIFIK